MELLFRHIWVVALLGTVIGALLWRRRAREHLERDPSLEDGYRRLALWGGIFGSLPLIVMGLGILVGGVEGTFAYLTPGTAKGGWVVAFYATIGILWILGLGWIFLAGGARTLVDHPGVFGYSATKPWHVKAFAVLTVVGGVVALLFLSGWEFDLAFFTGGTGDAATVFVVYDGFWKIVLIALAFLLFGVVVLIIAIVRIRHQRAQTEPVEPRKRFGARFMLIWGVGWLVLGGIGFGACVVSSYGLVRAYEDGRAEVVEGTVRVLYEQPREGHTKGDQIEIDDVTLEIHHFHLTPAYTKTIAYGGVLREGVHARVWHHDRKILRIDLPKGD